MSVRLDSSSWWLRPLWLMSVCLLLGGVSSRVSAQERPNVLLILADDLGWTDLACYGSNLHQTPHIDRLASQSMRFTNAYAAAPICSPTRASIMTGKCPARLHMTIWYEGAVHEPPKHRKLIPPRATANLPHEEVTLAEVLKSAGYVTAHVGKWHLGDAAHYPETQGFDINIGGTFWGAPPTFFYPFRGFWAGSHEFRYVPHLEWSKPGDCLTDRLTDEALKIIDATKDRPFYLNLCLHAVHTPIEGKPELVEYYKKRIRPGLQHQNPTYAAMVHTLDQNVGRILAKLEEHQIAERTLVILVSDNGGVVHKTRYGQVTDNSPLRSGKGSLYEGGIRVPLIVRWPGVTPAGSVCNEMVGTQDFYPTILEVTQQTGDERHNRTLDGVSLTSLLRTPTTSLARNTLHWHYPHYYPTTSPVSAVRSADWKLLEFHEDSHVELYNLRDDMGETKDRADDFPEKAAELRRNLHEWRSAVDAQMPLPNPDS